MRLDVKIPHELVNTFEELFRPYDLFDYTELSNVLVSSTGKKHESPRAHVCTIFNEVRMETIRDVIG